MNHFPVSPEPSEDLPELLRAAADDAGAAASAIDDDDYLALVRTRGLALRRRRRNATFLAGAACLAVVAVVGASVVLNLPGSSAPIAPAAPSHTAPAVSASPSAPPSGVPLTFPTCGAAVPDVFPDSVAQTPGAGALALVSEAHIDADGNPLPRALATDGIFATGTEISPFIPLLLVNGGTDLATGTMSTAAQVVLAQNGIVVATGNPATPPSEALDLAGEATTPIATSNPVPCASTDGTELDPATDLPDGDYEAYAVLNTAPIDNPQSPDSAWTPMPVYGGPWPVRIGDPVDPPLTSALQCGDETAEISTNTSFVRLNLSPVDSFDPNGSPAGALTVGMSRLDDSDIGSLDLSRVLVYLLDDDGLVVAMTDAEPPAPRLWEPNADAGPSLQPDLPVVNCATGERVSPGDYTLLVQANMTGRTDATGMATTPVGVEAFAPRTPIRYGEADPQALPALDPTAVFPACGAPVPKGKPEFSVKGVGSVTSFANPDPTNPPSFSADATVTNRGTDRVLGNMASSITAVFVQNGRVVGAEENTTDDAQDFDLAPGATMSTTVGSSSGICGLPDGESRGLPPGDYEIWGTLDLYLKERQAPNGEATSTNEKLQATGRMDKVAIVPAR